MTSPRRRKGIVTKVSLHSTAVVCHADRPVPPPLRGRLGEGFGTQKRKLVVRREPRPPPLPQGEGSSAALFKTSRLCHKKKPSFNRCELPCRQACSSPLAGEVRRGVRDTKTKACREERTPPPAPPARGGEQRGSVQNQSSLSQEKTFI